MLIGGGAGGGYDVYFRTFARHMTKHIPGNPNIVAKNMPAASGLAAANTLYTTAEKDGSIIGAFTNSVPMDPLFGNPGARYDAQKFNWLGSHRQAAERLRDLAHEPDQDDRSRPASAK